MQTQRLFLLFNLTIFLACNFISLFGGTNFVLFGPPGSGKGTFSQFIVQQYSYQHICPGNVYREEIEKQTPLGKIVEPVVKAGQFVDQDITYALVFDRISQDRDKKPFILDAYVRDEKSFQLLGKLLLAFNKINDTKCLYFCADDQTCIKRMAGRAICPNCHAVFNDETRAPQVINKCDFCGSVLKIRPLDKDIEESKKRLAYYRNTVEPLIEKAKELYTCIEIDAQKSIAELHKQYKELMEQQ